ncbi:MAG: YmdB family metallophosphoesterase [Spirochaetales bacterium]|nr:YmdB family metallophosphoesterase [Spirochaetales bacterium]
MIKILFLGEIVGRAGIAAVKKGLDGVKKKYEIDYTVANGEGVTNGFGLGKAHALQLFKMGIDLLTGGEKLFYKLDMVEFLPKASFILRPLNYPQQTPGRSVKNITIKDRKLVIINLQGNSDMRQNIQNAFISIDSFLKKVEDDTISIVQFHAATTAEKATMLHYLDGRTAAVIGTHTKVLSADDFVTEKGTGYISDNGRVGAFMSVGGFAPENEIHKLKSQIPERSKESWDDGIIQGVVVEINEITGRCENIVPIKEKVSIERPKEN